MARKPRQRPTEGELAILRVLWKLGRATVREVHEALGGSKRSAYTTTLKLMQIMNDKGLVRRDESPFAHVYEPAVGQEETQRGLVSDLLSKAFDGSVGKLVMQALAAGEVSAQELDEIRRLLDEHGND